MTVTTQTFTAPNGTVFPYQGDGSGHAHIAPAIGEPSVEVPIDDLLAFVAHVITERQRRDGAAVVTMQADVLRITNGEGA